MKKPFEFAAVTALLVGLMAATSVLAQSISVSPSSSAHASTSVPVSGALARSDATVTSVDGDATFRALGEKNGIEKIVKELLPILLADSRIRQSFKDVDMERLSAKLQEQFCVLAGGPCKYSGKDMKLIHEDLKITNAQFNALAEDLQVAMDRQGVAPRAQNKLIGKLAPMQREVVTR
jgi:hemoglobin